MHRRRYGIFVTMRVENLFVTISRLMGGLFFLVSFLLIEDKNTISRFKSLSRIQFE